MKQTQKGHLRIFFSYAGGIGKTQAMLKAAQTAKGRGVDVVVGCLASHDSGEAVALPDGLELLWQSGGNAGDSLDLDLALARTPELILIDELAYSNGEHSRHRKRYQDVEELLNAGIDVYTTVNIGNIESLHDTVAAITGVVTWDRIPDSVFDNADHVELIDVEPQELIGRIREASAAANITVGQLTALRELALRRCADRVRRLSETLRETSGFRTEEHILACLSSAPSNAKIIRTAARMAKAFNSQFTALYVETPDFSVATPENKARLKDNQKLAEQLGAGIETVYGEDVPYQIAEFARLSGITRIVLGRSAAARKHFFSKPTLTEQLLSYVPEIDIHIIPDQSAEVSYRPKKARDTRAGSIFKNTVKSLGILVGATLLCGLFDHLDFTDASIIMVYILGVLLTSIATSHRIYSLISSIASVFIFNFLFIAPRFSLAYDSGYPVTFLVMFLTAYITGTFALRYKEQARQSAKIAHRTKILFDTDRLLSKADGKEEIIQAAAEQIVKLLDRNIVMFGTEDGCLSGPHIFRAGSKDWQPYDGEKELAAADWVQKNNHAAGATTDTLSDAQCLYLPLRVNDRVYGVVGIEVNDATLDASEHSILRSILGEAALALENEKNAREKEAAAVLAESEQLRANLLRTISHDLRTPLTTISGNADNLMRNNGQIDEQTRQQIYADIYDDSIWLINLVENLLYATRIEEGRMTLNTSPELLSEILEAAVRHVGRKSDEHPLTAICEDDFLLVRADAKLIVQVIINLVDNANKYTPAGSPVTVTARKRGTLAEILVADVGEGIPEEEKSKIFDKFYCSNHKIADHRRSLGLGLYLCKVIVEAHGGTIHVTDNEPRGSVFCVTLPVEEVPYHE